MLISYICSHIDHCPSLCSYPFLSIWQRAAARATSLGTHFGGQWTPAARPEGRPPEEGEPVLSKYKAPPQGSRDDPRRPPQRQPARAYAAGLLPGSPTHTSHARNMGIDTGHDRQRKATADPYLLLALKHIHATMVEPTAPGNTRPPAVPVVALCAVLSRPSGSGWCCVVLPVVLGCLLFGLAVLCRLPVGLDVVLRWGSPCLGVWLGALRFGVVCFGAPLPCVVF